MEIKPNKPLHALKCIPDSGSYSKIGSSLGEELEFESVELAAIRYEEREEIRRSMQSTGLIDPNDWNDDNYPDYYLLGS